jgi:outer membrane lipoprotein-sorting protein
MKKLGIILIAVIALFSIVAVGCGGGEEATPTPTKAPGATVAPGTTATPEATAEPTSPPQPSGELGDILGKASAIDSVTYDMVMTGTGMPSSTTKMWLKNEAQKMKTETTVQGQTSVLLVDWGSEVAYSYMPAQNLAIKMDLGTAPESPLEGTGIIEGYDPTVIGTETYDGKECLVVEYDAEGVQTKMWLWKEYGFPVKVVTTADDATITVEYKNIDLGPIPDSVFELPEGVEIMELPS